MMPVGFRVKEATTGKTTGRERSGELMPVSYILLVIGIIYFICAILLESLRQAAIVICITSRSSVVF
ncbi:MAG: hypothetical protein ACLUPL_03465 [Butyricimonas virosa]